MRLIWRGEAFHLGTFSGNLALDDCRLCILHHLSCAPHNLRHTWCPSMSHHNTDVSWYRYTCVLCRTCYQRISTSQGTCTRVLVVKSLAFIVSCCRFDPGGADHGFLDCNIITYFLDYLRDHIQRTEKHKHVALYYSYLVPKLLTSGHSAVKVQSLNVHDQHYLEILL